MRTSRWWPSIALCACALTVFVPAAPSQTVVDIELGGSFTGVIDAPGIDTVQVRFMAEQGTRVRVTVRADRGASLEPTVSMSDPGGAPVDLGPGQQIRWLPVQNSLHYFTTTATGTYTLVIGGASGSGGFWGRASGDGAAPNVETGTLSGTVTNSLTGEGIPDVEILANSSVVAVTDANGDYSGKLATGSYTITFTADGFQVLARSADVTTGSPTILDVELVPLVPVTISASISGDAEPNGEMTAVVDIQMPPGAVLNSITWTQEYGAAASIASPDADTSMVTLGAAVAYKDELVQVLSEPPVGQEDLPPNVPLPPGEFPGGLQNRFQVVGVNPFALEEAGLVVLRVDVDTEFGIFSDEVEVHTAIPWKTATALRNVPNGAPVLLQGKEQATYDWVLVPPAGSMATLSDATTRNPYFTPDISGVYKVEVTDLAGGADAPLTLEIFSGTWRGVIVDQDLDGRPVPDTGCTFCHNDTLAPDKFTPWAQTGHAEIFKDNLNTSTHYGGSCFPCHSVGYDPELDNSGFDNASDYQDFLDAGLINNPGDNWTRVVEEFPETALLANIQCDNCHGPQNSTGHGFAAPLGDPRVDISADVCATCHGEPLRHARFQQWQLSAHANYELAIDEGDSGSCSRCHTGNGFLKWLPILLDDDPNTDPLDDVEVDWTTDETHPQTCATCHDPHSIGTTSGSDPNATVRISGDTPPLIAGFQVNDVGKGAICMTCHNSRRGLRNDDVFDDYVGTSEVARAPHGSAQTDVVVGQNAYLVEVGNPGGHATLEDVCVDCHMEATPPPDILSYDQGGTNHTFFAARTICVECHSPRVTADDVQGAIQQLLDEVQALVENSLLDLMGDLIAQGNTIDLDGDAVVTDVADVDSIEFGESRGQQAITTTLVGGTVVGPLSLSAIDVVDGSSMVIGPLYQFADPVVLKSGWNWGLINNDGSRGVHNPFFARTALLAARDGMVAAGMGLAAPSSLPLQRGRELWPGVGREARSSEGR